MLKEGSTTIKARETLTAEEWPAAPRVQSRKERRVTEVKISKTSPSMTGTWEELSFP